MSSPNRIQINQANAQHSTGPKTPEGKKISSQNALRHGLTGQKIVLMPTEDPEVYNLHLKSFTDDLRPQGAIETHLVQTLADTSWRMNRVMALETDLLTLGSPQNIFDTIAVVDAFEKQSKSLSNLSLHSQRLARLFERTQTQLREIQKIRRAQEKQLLEEYLDITEMYEDKGEAYDPSEDGFVFSKQQIQEAIQSRNRENRALEAYEYEPGEAGAA